MGIEIERKFLVAHLPPAFDGIAGEPIRQGYLVADDDAGIEVRVRHKKKRFSQTIKVGDGLCRTEIEIALSRAQFDQLWPYTDGRRVDKTRYAVAVGPHMAELDIFSGDLEGLRLVEVEFTSVAASQRFVAPDWFGREVTADKRYKNKALAVHGIPGLRRRQGQRC